MKYSDIGKKTLIVVVSVFLFLSFVEINLRVLGFVYARKPALVKLKSDNTYYIACIGDSFTYGWGVDASQSYPSQLETKLNQSGLPLHFKVYNLGVPGSNSSQQLALFADLVSQRGRPDAVVLITGANDSWNWAGSNMDKVMQDPGARKKAAFTLRRFIADLRLYKLVKIGWLNMHGLTPESNLDVFQVIQKRENMETDILDRLLEYNLERFIELAKNNNVTLLLQSYPFGDVSGKGVVARVAAGHAIPFINNRDAFREELKKVDYRQLFLYDNSHPTALGYSIMVRNLYLLIMREAASARGLGTHSLMDGTQAVQAAAKAAKERK